MTASSRSEPAADAPGSGDGRQRGGPVWPAVPRPLRYAGVASVCVLAATAVGYLVLHLAVMVAPLTLAVIVTLLRDEPGRVRVVLARLDVAALLDMVVSQPRRYGAGEPELLARLFTLLREVAWASRDGDLHGAVADQVARLRATVAAQPFDDTERATLTGLADLVGAALTRRWPEGDRPDLIEGAFRVD